MEYKQRHAFDGAGYCIFCGINCDNCLSAHCEDEEDNINEKEEE